MAQARSGCRIALRAIGLRPISALVDITNFFAIDLGRPLHVFDVNRIAGGRLTLRPGAGETFRALNGKDVTVTSADCVIADAEGGDLARRRDGRRAHRLHRDDHGCSSSNALISILWRWHSPAAAINLRATRGRGSSAGSTPR